MSKNDLLSIPLDDDAVDMVCHVANDEYCCEENYNLVFFFGKLINDDPFVEDRINEKKYYTKCPYCDKLIQFKTKPLDGEPFTCPYCKSEGALYDFRDPNSSVNDNDLLRYGFLEKLDKGYVLRLFDVWLDYSDRYIDNYTLFDYNAVIECCEVGREYWYEGKVRYYADNSGAFKPVDTIQDNEYLIVNYSDDFDDCGVQIIEDIISEFPHAKTFMEMISLRGSYMTFDTLNKYGFDRLTYDYLYIPEEFGDSRKISEVLKLDYNQVIAYADKSDFSGEEMLFMRELNRYGLSFSRKNMRIMKSLSNRNPCVFTKDNVKKTFKYLRNQMSRVKTGDNVPGDFFDYILECRKLGLDTEKSEIRYPTDLHKAHERTSALVKIEANRDMDERIRSVYERLHKACEFTDGDYCIVMPACSEDIIREGKEQSHCVGGYCERMANGEDIILFLRKVNEPDKAFYTVELRPSMNKFELVQCRGLRNKDRSADVDEFLKRYETWFNHRKFDAETDMHRKYYKAVCKLPDGRYISHWDNVTEYKVGEVIETCVNPDPDLTAVQGIHIASLEFAKNYGDAWDNAAILEIEVDMRDVVIPNAKDQIRTKRGKVLREVPMSELGDWGIRHSKGVAA